MDAASKVIRQAWEDILQVPTAYWIFLGAYSFIGFGSPMPSKITWLEIAIGAGLFIGGLLLTKGVISGMAQKLGKRTFILCCLLLVVPISIALFHGYAVKDISRDVIPLLFLLATPVMLAYSSKAVGRSGLRFLVTLALLVVGAVGAVTFWLSAVSYYGSLEKAGAAMRGGLSQYIQNANNTSQASQVSKEASQVSKEASQVSKEVSQVSKEVSQVSKEVSQVSKEVSQVSKEVSQVSRSSQASKEVSQASKEVSQDGKGSSPIKILGMYDPAVFFSCLFLCSWGVVLIVRGWKYSLGGCILLGAGAVIGYELMMLGLRSYTFLLATVMLLIAGTQIKQRGFYYRLLPLAILMGVIFFPQIEGAIQLLWTKQLAVGTNGKSAEWLAVLSTISTDIWSLLFGIGWGGVVDNPILAAPTRFTHSMLSFFLLKSGVVGLTMMLAVMASLFIYGRSMGDSKTMPVSRLIILSSCLPPLLIGVFFEPTYKMLSYGVILALFVLVLPSGASRNVAATQGGNNGQSF